MVEETGRRAALRPGRCSMHPSAPEVAACRRCGRPLCIACAIPFRGEAIGPECLSTVLPETTVTAKVEAHASGAAQRLAIAGFAIIVVLSVLPWSRYGSARGLLSAWRPHWSLVAVLAAVAGLAFAMVVSRRPFSPLLEATVVATLAVVAAIASVLHHYRPPPLSAPTIVPVLAVVGAGLALAGGVSMAAGGLHPLRRHP